MSSDPWGTSSGLIEEYSGVVEDSWFGINPQYSEKAMCIMWIVRVDNPEEFPQLEEGKVQEQFSVGEGWESLDGGETIEFPGSPNRKIHSNSQYGKIIDRAIKDWGMRDILSERGAGPTEAKIWEGLRFEFKAEERPPFINRQTKEEVKLSPKVMPVSFLGQDGAPAERSPTFDVSQLNLTDSELEDLTNCANKSDAHGEFLDAAMKLTWLPSNGKVVAALADKSFWQALRTEF